MGDFDGGLDGVVMEFGGLLAWAMAFGALRVYVGEWEHCSCILRLDWRTLFVTMICPRVVTYGGSRISHPT